ncbi:hypothetical protein RSAG8_07650, partial [Rhizoctonia solani AG-8 WAC10335]
MSQARKHSETLMQVWNDLSNYEYGDSSPLTLLSGYNLLWASVAEIYTNIKDEVLRIENENPQLRGSTMVDQQTDTHDLPKLPVPTPAPSVSPQLSKTFAQAAAPSNMTGESTLRAIPRKTHPAPTKPSNPTRLIARLHDQPNLPIRNSPATKCFRRLTEAISKSPGQASNGPRLLGVQWNKKGNLILSFSNGTSRTTIKACYPAMRSVLGSESRIEFDFDVPWGRVHLANICAREGEDHILASEQDLQESLQYNPAIQSLKITMKARWLKKPEFITGMHTSAIIAFEDPDGTIEHSLLKSKIFAFGELVTMKKWHTKQPYRRIGVEDKE